MKTSGKILICDDDLNSIDLLEKILGKNQSHFIASVNSGERCLEKLDTSFDLVMIDIRLPGINGLETLKKIRDKYPSMVVIMMTAYSSENIVIESLRLGAFNYIKKPFDIDLRFLIFLLCLWFVFFHLKLKHFFCVFEAKNV